MKIARPVPRRRPEGTIALINVVFLLLIFFLIAGSLTPPLDGDVSMVETSQADASGPPDAVSARRDGQLYYRGEPVTAAAFLETRSAESGGDGGAPDIKLVADKDLPARRLLEILEEFRSLGAGKVLVITRRAGA
ncbi:biopolymer transport protein ExbD [Hoeflea marina]|uniref:Biopolymer transport protein ExbD n=1 Tax=Hoeflea marina TaxID=274592 RepID=A0A317PQU2_9HYPH|nr:biopolymer transporter ExbD [Hoeflea marina]PWW03843.1 biopolymer transport protein ExbD [Hoeflea marina]